MVGWWRFGGGGGGVRLRREVVGARDVDGRVVDGGGGEFAHGDDGWRGRRWRLGWVGHRGVKGGIGGA